MEEKERYEIHIYDDCVDLYDNGVLDKSISDSWELEKLLNQQDKENHKLKQQLHELPKKILKDIQENFDWKQCCEIRKYYDQQYIWFNYVAFNDFLDTIFKKFGGEDESLCCNVKQ